MSNKTTLRSAAVAPLPIGSGGNSDTARQMNNMNASLTMMSVQSGADAKYDPPIPQPQTTAKLVQAFCSSPFEKTKHDTIPMLLGLVGIVCIVYGVTTK
jgi:hypothetical protein